MTGNSLLDRDSVFLKISSGILASSWQPSQGILAVIYGWCLRTESHIDSFKIMGILIGTGGAVFMILYGDHSEDGDDNLWRTLGGSIMFFCNCSASVFYLILGQPAMRAGIPSATITGYGYIIASLLMVIAALIVESSDEILNFLCSDCTGAWDVPTVTIYALIYWILIQSVVSYLLITWANRYADPSVNCAYAVVQPLTATMASRLLLLFHVVPDCEDIASDSTRSCLYGPGIEDLGAIGICLGLYFVIYSDHKKRKRESQDHQNSNCQEYTVVGIQM